MHTASLSQQALDHLLSLPDLTSHSDHALGTMVQALQTAAVELSSNAGVAVDATLERGQRIVQAQHNYHLLGYAPDEVVLSQAHTHWVDAQRLLRTQTTSVILEHLERLVAHPQPMLLLAPGMVYRRDVRDKTHCGQPHQMDVWWLLPRSQTPDDPTAWLLDLMAQTLPGVPTRALPTRHPYTQRGIEVQAQWQGQWLEIGEGGRIDPALLERLGLDSMVWSGIASGWGLDRLVMVRKALPDIRLLRDPLPNIAQQMRDLRPWKAISRQPHAVRELSMARPAHETEEALTERILEALPTEASGCLQTVAVGKSWQAEDLPAQALERLGLAPGQWNQVVSLVWQSPARSLGRDEVNGWSRQVYRACHMGTGWAYCP